MTMLTPEMRSISASTVRSGAGGNVETQLTLDRRAAPEPASARATMRLRGHRDAQRLEPGAKLRGMQLAPRACGASAAEATNAPMTAQFERDFLLWCLCRDVRSHRDLLPS